MEWLNNIINSIWSLVPLGMVILIYLTYRDVRRLRKEFDKKFKM